MKRLFIPVALLVVAGFGLTQAGVIGAQEDQTPHAPLIQRLVERFGLKEDEVTAVFNEHREERRSQMHARYEERLQQLVSEGKISEAQKELIAAKHEEMRTSNQEAWQQKATMSPEERRTFMETKHDEFTAWAEANGIDVQELIGLGGNGMGIGMGMRGGQRR